MLTFSAFRSFSRPALLAGLALAGLSLMGCARAAVTPAGDPTASPATAGHDMAAHAGHTTSASTAATAPVTSTMAHDHNAGLPPVTIPAGAIITEADVRFMQGMIAHHAQAVAMTRLAASAGANPRVLKLAQKIDLSQAGEIVLMQEWLRAYGQFAPDTSAWRTMTMHGMLTPEEMAKLAAARGAEYDRLFLTYMIRHHEGALQMVKDLFATPRAGQEVDISVFANDVESTQSAEIALMRVMLFEL